MLKNNPLHLGAKKDAADNAGPGKHRIGTPVRDVIRHVLGGEREKGNDTTDTKDEPK